MLKLFTICSTLLHDIETLHFVAAEHMMISCVYLRNTAFQQTDIGVFPK